MEMVRPYFRWHCISQRTITEGLAWPGLGRLWVASLNHKILYHTMKKQPFIGVIFYQFDEILAVFWRVVVQTDNNFTNIGLY